MTDAGVSARAAAPATDAAAALLAALVAGGVRHIVVSPGSRSQALALVAAGLERAGRIRLHVRIDERVAGFTALGIGRETGTPAVVLCTSGTAVANLLPAALEAHHSGVPLLILTADRPPELRGVGANQTTRQPGTFSAATRLELDLPTPDETDEDGEGEQSRMLRATGAEALAAARGGEGRAAGPVHLNLPYREPLGGAVPPWLIAATSRDETAHEPEASGALYQGGGGIGAADAAALDTATRLLDRGPRTVVIAGAGAGPAAEELSHAAGWPLIAEIVSGARFGRNVVHGYRGLLADRELGGRVQRAVVFGHPTLSREVTALVSRADVEVLAVRGPGEPLNLNGGTSTVEAVALASASSAPSDAAAREADREWLGAWLRASRAASVDLSPVAPDPRRLASAVPSERREALETEVAALRAPLDRAALVDAVWRATWPHDRLFFGSSRLVRVADALLPGKKVPVHSNRGLAGIDGTVATATGVAVASQDDGRPGITRVVLGDLALLHDAGALLLPPDETAPRMQVIVGNDGGGTIFDGLEVATVADPAAMDRVLYTPHAVQLAQLAAAYGWEHRQARTRADLDQLLTAPVTGRQLIEVALPR